MIRYALMFALLAAPAPCGAQTAAPPAPSQPSPCADSAYRQFDFWVGRWNVSPNGSDKVVAQSLIERVYGGCGVRENWMPGNHQDGGSLNTYRPAEKAWRQTWIDSGGSRGDFKGGWTGRAMVLTGDWPGPDGKPNLTRMTYTPNGDGSVRQFGEASTDGGKTWKPAFDFIYRPAKP
ncbi:MAG TPA: hypothetical protein VGC92_06085 [Phenylobacterium sp.]|jgi:hypothetical protein